MFTGLVQALGQVETAGPTQLKIQICEPDGGLLEGLALGDSVAVDGVCLTVESQGNQGFIATVSPETVDRTCLGQRSKTRTPVNLEPSLRVGGKMGGHFVTGHVDGVGELQSVLMTAGAWELTFGPVADFWEQWEGAIAPYLVNKGSIAVNGISLTIARCDRHNFTVAVIPHTYRHTNLAHLTPGNWVNLEGDILGKYVEKFLNRGETPLSLDFLAEHGYG